jgi:chromosome segregation protein
MRIKSLEMSGFKSFPDRTVVNFEEGITGVVGPNGCGKSNIVDAIRWVMGEMSAKHLRGQSMEDVIFSGCETRPSLGMSQVFLTFDNSDGRAPADYAQYSEIQVGRRLYRSGESEYFINKTPCRLKDIVDLFLGTGVGTKAYSIVEQGMVSQMVSAKPEDRRTLIEEAAGISKFKARKEAALRKMESTRQNLARLSDILGELTRQINSLKRQAKKAERYRRVSDELRSRELTLAATRHRMQRQELEELVSKNEGLSQAKAASSARLAEYENSLETLRLTQTEMEREVDGVQQELYRVQHTVKLSEAKIQHKTNEQAAQGKQLEAWTRELAALKARIAESDELIDKANATLVEADLRRAGSAEITSALETLVESLREEHGVRREECDRHNKAIMTDGEAIANLSASLEHLERRRVDTTSRLAKDQAEIDSIDRRTSQIRDELDRRSQEIEACGQHKAKLSDEREKALAALDEERSKLREAEDALKSIQNEVADRRSRLASLTELKKNLEGYRDGVRAVLGRVDANGERLAGIVGTVSDLLETEPEYETALSAVLGEKLQYVVVKSYQEGVEAIDYLRQAARGRGSFIPLNVRVASEDRSEPRGEGVVGPLTNFVRFDHDLSQIFNHLLGDVVLVEDLEGALRLWQKGSFKKTFVSRDGCVVDPSGVVTGGRGSGVEEQLIAQKRRLKELTGELNLVEKELGPAQAQVDGVSERVTSQEKSIEDLSRDIHAQELKHLGMERDCDQLKEELTRRDKERDDLTVETGKLADELRGVEEELTESTRRLEQHTTHRQEAINKVTTLEGELGELASKLSRRETELIDLKVDLAQAEERQASAARELVGLIQTKTQATLGAGRKHSEIRAANQRTTVLKREIEGLRADLNLAVRSVGKLQETQRVLTQRYQTEAARVRDEELKIREIRKRHDEDLSALHDVEITLTEHRGKLQYLAEGIRERYRLDLPSIEAQYARDDIDLEAEGEAVDQLKERLEKLGPVNVDAIQEFEEISARHDFLSKQNEDLAASLDNLSKAIIRINRTSRQRFRRAFESVDEKFQQLFPKLFNGGKARLMLTDEENLLETGVEIVAQPPGKKLQSITLLSGGEKALTAVALIFSIFLIKPSPFCLLDEVDAPLDDANIDRFNDLIGSMTPHSQFILITHNKRTMERTNMLYGVTMEEQGVSKIVSVRLEGEKGAEPQVA